MRTPRAARVAALAPLTLGAVLSAQIPFEQAQRDLQSADADTRLRTVQMLKDAAYAEAAVPLARLLGGPQDAAELDAIAAGVNIFVAPRVGAKKRVRLAVGKRSAAAP